MTTFWMTGSSGIGIPMSFVPRSGLSCVGLVFSLPAGVSEGKFTESMGIIPMDIYGSYPWIIPINHLENHLPMVRRCLISQDFSHENERNWGKKGTRAAFHNVTNVGHREALYSWNRFLASVNNTFLIEPMQQNVRGIACENEHIFKTLINGR